ncbi:uncharacterized protein PG986_003697 [Apiospora aurea]|uniref:Uncharacterized protein n=1 Tax=Apiospora aurea TaxID=335848 RepID=A0ABR1QSE6_9PEZI
MSPPVAAAQTVFATWQPAKLNLERLDDMRDLLLLHRVRVGCKEMIRSSTAGANFPPARDDGAIRREALTWEGPGSTRIS